MLRFLKQRQKRFRHPVNAKNIGLKRFLQHLNTQLRARVPIERNPRIVHQNIEASIAPLHFGCRFLHAGLRSHVDFDEFGGKSLRVKICHSLFSACAVAGAHQHQNTLRGELTRNLSSYSFVRTGHKCNRFSHRVRYDNRRGGHPSQITQSAHQA